MITGEGHPTAKSSPPKLIQAGPNAAAVHWEPHPPQELISLQVSGTGMSINKCFIRFDNCHGYKIVAMQLMVIMQYSHIPRYHTDTFTSSPD